MPLPTEAEMDELVARLGSLECRLLVECAPESRLDPAWLRARRLLDGTRSVVCLALRSESSVAEAFSSLDDSTRLLDDLTRPQMRRFPAHAGSRVVPSP